uniref:Uncharacterized protein n=1 Tax=Oryza glumipatula TaxID=40148 RepID=A0A0D9Y8U8_9ORYZ
MEWTGCCSVHGTGGSWAGLSAADSDDSDECEAVTGGSRTALSGGGSRRPTGKSRRQSVDLRRGSTFVLGGGGAWCGGSRRRYAGESRRQQRIYINRSTVTSGALDRAYLAMVRSRYRSMIRTSYGDKMGDRETRIAPAVRYLTFTRPRVSRPSCLKCHLPDCQADAFK